MSRDSSAEVCASAEVKLAAQSNRVIVCFMVYVLVQLLSTKISAKEEMEIHTVVKAALDDSNHMIMLTIEQECCVLLFR
jgi:hypothetical protein